MKYVPATFSKTQSIVGTGSFSIFKHQLFSFKEASAWIAKL